MTPQKSCFLRVFKWKKRENSVFTNGIDVQKLQERSRRFPVKSNTSQCHCITAISQALRLHTPAHTNLLNTFNVPHYTDCDGQALVPLTTKFCSPPQWEQTHGITRTLHNFRLVGAGCSEVTKFTVKRANVKRCILEQSHVRHTIWCKVTKMYCQWLGDRLFGKRLMEFLAALKKEPFMPQCKPQWNCIWPILSVWGWAAAPRSPHCYTPLTAFTCTLALGCLSLQHLSRSECSSQSGTRRASSKAHIVWPCWTILALGASHSSKEGTKKKTDAGLTALIPLVSFLTPSKRPDVHPAPGTWSQHSMPLSPLLVLWPRGRTFTAGCKMPSSHCKGWGSAQSHHTDLKLRQEFLVFYLIAQMPMYFPFKNWKNRDR